MRVFPFSPTGKEASDDRASQFIYCCHCNSSDRSWHDALRLGSRRLTAAGEELVALAGLLSSFGEAADRTLQKLSGMRLSAPTVRRTTEDAGARLRQMLDQQIAFQAPKTWDWNRDAEGRRCAYVSIDATGVRQQGERGAKADGRMVYVGMIYNPPAHEESAPIGDRRYLAGLYDLTDLGRELHREALAVGWQQAEVQIALSDGATCLEKFLKTYFPKAVLILDFFHASEHLAELARVLHPREEDFQQVYGCWRKLMKQQGGRAVLAELERLERTGWSPEAQEAWRKEIGYFRNNVDRMDYPDYRAKGWRIGSGPIEAACKTVIGARMKGTGMRWKPPAIDE
ncbi:MAG: hypothetical protein A2W31_18555, partial [Planctomycetes bacterium RBG_16_64_10]